MWILIYCKLYQSSKKRFDARFICILYTHIQVIRMIYRNLFIHKFIYAFKTVLTKLAITYVLHINIMISNLKKPLFKKTKMVNATDHKRQCIYSRL